MNKKKSIYGDLANYFLIFLLGNFSTKIISILMLPMYTSLLSPEEYGMIDIINSTVQCLVPIVSMELGSAILRFGMDKSTNKSDIITVGIQLPIINCILLFPILFIVLKKTGFANLYCFVILLLLTQVLNITISYFAKALEYNVVYAISGTIQVLVFVFCNIIFLKYFRWGVQGYLVSSVISVVFSTVWISFRISLKRYSKICIMKFSIVRQLLKFSIPLIPMNMAWWVIMQSDRYMLSYFCGISVVGLYAIANKIPTFLQSIISIFSQAWQMSTIKIFDESPEVMRLYFENMLRKYYKVSFTIAASLVVCSKYVIFFLTNNSYYNSWRYVPFLLVSSVLSGISGMVAAIYSAYQNNATIATSTILGAFLNVCLNYVLIPICGIQGATFASCLSYFVIVIYRFRDVNKFIVFDKAYGLLLKNMFLISMLSILYINELKLVTWLTYFLMIFINREAYILIFKEVAEKIHGYYIKCKKDI